MKKVYSIALFVLIAGIVQAQDITSDLEGYWPLDTIENGSTPDLSGNNRGAVTGAGVPIVTAGKLGNAVFFDGSSDFITEWTGIGGNNPRTISMWVKTTDGSNAGFTGWGANNTGEKWHFRTNENAGNGVVGAIRTEYAGSQTVGTKFILDGEWHHVVGVFEGDFPQDVTHYVDGELDPQSWVGAMDLQINTAEQDVVSIGSRLQGSSWQRKQGSIDEARIYSRALSAEDVRALYEEALVEQNRAVRAFSAGSAAPGLPINVDLSLSTPVSGTLTESIPDGWAASNISNGGSINGQTITWNLDASINAVSYTAEPSDGASNVFSGDLDGLFTDGAIQITTLSGKVGEFDFHADIGSVAAAGDASFDGSEYNITGSGVDVWGSADGFHYAFKELSGAFIIRGNALVFPFESGNDWVKGGIMVRNNLTAGSSFGFLLVRTDLQMASQARTTQGGSAVTVNDLFAEQNGDMELERRGNLISFFYIDDSGNRQPFGEVVLEDLQDPIYLGLGVTSHEDGSLSELFFSDLEIEQIAQTGARLISTGDNRPTFGDVLTITIDAATSGDNTVVTEVPPAGWAISNIQASVGNAAATANGEIEWTVTQGGNATLTYDLIIPDNSSEPVITGVFSGNVGGEVIVGQTSIEIAGLLPESVLSQQDIDSGLIGYWSFNENNGTTANDDSGNNRHAEFAGEPQWVEGVSGTALEFDGDDYLFTPEWYGIAGNTPRTVVCWVNSTATNTHGIVSWGLSNSQGQKNHIRINNSAGNGAVGAIRTEVEGTFNIGTTVVNDGEWHMIASVFPSGGQFVVDYIHYVDGLIETRSGTNGNGETILIDTAADPAVSDQEFRIGMRVQGGGENFYPGMIDEVRIYDRGLTAAEVQAVFVTDGGGVDTNVREYMLY